MDILKVLKEVSEGTMKEVVKSMKKKKANEKGTISCAMSGHESSFSLAKEITGGDTLAHYLFFLLIYWNDARKGWCIKNGNGEDEFISLCHEEYILKEAVKRLNTIEAEMKYEGENIETIGRETQLFKALTPETAQGFLSKLLGIKVKDENGNFILSLTSNELTFEQQKERFGGDTLFHWFVAVIHFQRQTQKQKAYDENNLDKIERLNKEEYLFERLIRLKKSSDEKLIEQKGAIPVGSSSVIGDIYE